MSFKLLKFRIEGVKLFENDFLEISFINEKRVNQNEIDDYEVNYLFNRSFTLNTIAFIGINATGKTTVLDFINSILNFYLMSNGFEEFETKVSELCTENIDIEAYFYSNNKIYKITTKMTYKYDEEFSKKIFIIQEEKIYSKDKLSNIAHKNIFSFSESNLITTRTELIDKTRELTKHFLLPDDHSIFSSIVDSNKITYISTDTFFSNYNFVQRNLLLLPSFIKYLDPSIEKFKTISNTASISEKKFTLKLYGSEEKSVSAKDLEKYVSSGTIKGLNLLSRAVRVLKNGGYLIVDEIENHLNKSIVINLISLFSSEINKNGATLLFTTHYSEILDNLHRSDSIYILQKKNFEIVIQRMSNLLGSLDRSDLLKSDLIMSGEYGTAPNFNAYDEVIQELKVILNNTNLPNIKSNVPDDNEISRTHNNE